MKIGSRSQQHTCAICLEEKDRADLVFAFELLLCERCLSGDYLHALEERGCTCTLDGTSDDELMRSLIVDFPKDIPFNASFSRETFKHKFSKFFKKEVQVGVQHFDDLIYIATNSSRDTAKFLTDEKTQDGILAALMTMVRSGATIKLENQRAELQIDPRELTPEQEEALITFRRQLLLTPFASFIAYLDTFVGHVDNDALLSGSQS